MTTLRSLQRNQASTDSGYITATTDTDVTQFRARSSRIVAWLSAIGAGIAGYLTFTHFNRDALVCAVGSCGTVQSSSYATIGPVPIALLGLGMYLAIGLLAIGRIRNSGPLSLDQMTILSWSIAFAGTLYAAYLTYVELWVIHAVCQWCVASAIVGLLILIVEFATIWRTMLSDAAMSVSTSSD